MENNNGFFDRYQLLESSSERIATVYRAHDRKMGRDVAIHIYLPFCTATPQLKECLYQQLRLEASLMHPNLVSTFDVTEVGGNICQVTEWLEGVTLGGAVEQNRSFSLRESVGILRGLLSALSYLQQRNLRLDDLTPESLLLTNDGRIKLIGELINPAADTDPDPDREKRCITGTPAYMAPEKLKGALYTPAQESYAAAAIAYTLFAGEAAFARESTEKTFRAAFHDPLPELPAEVPERVRCWVMKGMEQDAPLRFGTAAEMLAELERLASRLFEQ